MTDGEGPSYPCAWISDRAGLLGRVLCGTVWVNVGFRSGRKEGRKGGRVGGKKEGRMDGWMDGRREGGREGGREGPDRTHSGYAPIR